MKKLYQDSIETWTQGRAMIEDFELFIHQILWILF